MILDEKLRWAGFWILDGLRGGQTRKYYDRIRYAWKKEVLLRRQKKESGI